MYKISVIIPVYNTEKYLQNCLDSVCLQTLSDIEIICINDCSTDNSLSILEEYALKDKRIKIINFEENKGAAVARNKGIEVAQGEYIGFVDSDDYIDLDFYEKLYNKAIETSADITKGSYKNAQTGFVDLTINDAIQKDKKNFCATYCSAIFKKDLLTVNKIKFPNIRDMEDPIFAFSAALKANKIIVLKDLNVIINKRADSITSQKLTPERFYDKLTGLKMLFDLDENCDSPYVLAYWFVMVILDSMKDCPVNENIAIQEFLSLFEKFKSNKNFIDKINERSPHICSFLFSKKRELYSTKFNADALKKLIDQYEIISFDIFDTLLLRTFVEPASVFNYIENKYNFKKFSQERPYAEQVTRALNKIRNINAEDITYDDIYKNLDKNYPGAKEIELDVEYNNLYANEELKECFNYALEQNKKIILVSDMYLNSTFLKKVLNKNGYYNFDKIYVSSETKKLKCTGSMFKYIINDLKVSPSKILHIGDNEIADVKKALGNGFKAFYYTSFNDLYNKQNHKLLDKIKYYPNLKTLESVKINKWISNNGKNDIDFWENFAYNNGGPIAVAWLSNLIQISKDRNLSDLYFIARDGYLLKKIYDSVYCESKMPKAHYVYATRKLKTLCINKNSEILDNETSKEYNKYINSVNTCGTSIGLIDTCAGAYSAQALIENFDKSKMFLGIYFVANFSSKYNNVNLSCISRNSIDKLFTWDIFEILFSSPEFPIENIKNGQPIYRKDNTDAEIYHKEIYPLIEKGILDYVKDFLSLYKDLNIQFDMEEVLKLIIHYWEHLSLSDIANFSKISLPQDASQRNYCTLMEKDAKLKVLR